LSRGLVTLFKSILFYSLGIKNIKGKCSSDYIKVAEVSVVTRIHNQIEFGSITWSPNLFLLKLNVWHLP